MYQNELDALFKAVRNGEVINNGDYMVKSNLAAIMARMAAYSGQTVTWDQALTSELHPACRRSWNWATWPRGPRRCPVRPSISDPWPPTHRRKPHEKQTSTAGIS